MATSKQGNVTKIYDLRTLGYDEIHKQLQQIAKDFESIKQSKKNATEGLANASDTQAIATYTTEIQRLKIEEQNLRVQRQQMLNEAKAAQILRDQENRTLKDQQKNVKAAAGSYNELYQQYRQLYQLVKSTPKGQVIDFQGQTLQFDQAINKLKELASEEQNFRRQFARDGLLVAEYTSGIIQAFQKADLGDLIGGQIAKAEQSLAGINTEFEQLKNEFNQAKATGVGDLDAIEQKLIENRKEAVNVTSQISALKEGLAGTGSIGDKVTKGIATGFKNIKDQLGGFVLAFVGIQTVLSKLEGFGEEAKAQFTEAEESAARFEAALKNLGRANEFDELNNNINELSARFKSLDNDDIRNATTQLVLFGKLTAAQIREILPVIIDFAAQQRKTVGESTEIFIKAIEGTDKPLKAFGLDLKDASTEQGKFAVLSDQLGAKIKGTAEEFEKSTSGGIARNRQEWKNLAEDVGKKVIPTLTAVAGVVVNVAGAILSIPFPVIIAGLTAVTAALALYKAEQIRSYVVTQIATKQGLIYNAYLIAQRIATLAVSAATRIATAEIVLFNGAIRISPIGIFLTALGLIIPAVALFASRLREAKKEQTALQEVTAKTNQIYNEQTAKINALVAIIKSSATADDTKRKALSDLTAIHSEYSKVLKNNVIDVQELDRVTKNLTASIQLQAAATASAQILAEKNAKVVEVRSARQIIESAIATGQKDLTDELTKEQQAIIKGFGSAKSQLLPTDQGGIKLFTGAFGGGVPLDPKQVLASLTKLENDRIKTLQQFQTINNKSQKDLDDFLKSQQVAAAGFEVDIKGLRAKIDALDKEIQDFQGTKSDLAKKVKEREDLQKQLDQLLDKNKKAVTGPSKLSADLQDNIKDIDALRDRMLAEEEIKRQQNTESEEKYLKNVLLINEIAIDKKLALIKGSNEEERKTIAQLNLEKLKDIQETNDKIFDIQSKALKDQLDQQIANIELERDQALQDPNLTKTERARIKLDADKKILDLQLQFNERIDRLEKQLAQQSLTNTKQSAEEIRKTRKAILDDQRSLDEAALADAQRAGAASVQQFKEVMAKLKLAIVQDSDLTADKRNKLLGIANDQENIGILAREVDSLQKQLPIYKQLLKDKLITDQQYSQFTTDLTNKQIELQNALTKGIADNIEKIKTLYKGLLDSGKITKDEYDKLIKDLNATSQAGVNETVKTAKSLKDLITGGLVKLFNINTDTAGGKALADSIGKGLELSYQLATQAMNNYFNAERDRINENLKLQEERLDMEKEQVEARAQSQAEIDSIEKQYAAKKKAAERAAGEQIKKTRRSEAKIAFATQLINIGVQASQYPFPASLIIFGILAAAAAAQYQIQLAAINRETFAHGGQPGKKRRGFFGSLSRSSDEVPLRGGKFGGRSHDHGGTQFAFKDRAYEAEVDELAIIRTRNAPKGKKYTITGTHEQIASAINKVGGGHDFAPGAEIIEKKRTIIDRIFNRQATISEKFERGGSITNKKITEKDERSLIDKIFNRKISEKFERGGSIAETNKTITENQVIDKQSKISSDINYFTSVIARVITENKTLVDRQDRKSIFNLVREQIFSNVNATDISSQSTEIITRIINQKMDEQKNKKITVTGTTTQILSTLDRHAVESLAFGGTVHVPAAGGQIQGPSHRDGGVNVSVKGKIFELEGDEAIINKRSVFDTTVRTITGTNMQILSMINKSGGGIDFKPGARIKEKKTFASGGILGSNLQAPLFVPASSQSAQDSGILDELKKITAGLAVNNQSNKVLAKEQSERIDRLQVQLSERALTKAQEKTIKQSSIGTL